MKKVIDGKVYNTETATEIEEYWNGFSTSDFKYCCETLYKTKRGNFFLCGKGGAMSKYSESCSGNCRCGGEGIIPLTLEEAKAWVEAHANEQYEALFGVEEA